MLGQVWGSTAQNYLKARARAHTHTSRLPLHWPPEVTAPSTMETTRGGPGRVPGHY